MFQHPSVAALRRELRRNAELRQRCGFDPLLGEAAVPTDSAYSHFLEALLEHGEAVRDLFHQLVEALRPQLPDLGRYLAIDGKALPSFGKPEKQDKAAPAGERKTDPGEPAAPTEAPDRRRDHDADWGVKTYRGKRADGTAWEKVVKWFGFELPLLVDTTYELPLNYTVTKASAAETLELLPLVEATEARHPEVLAQADQLAADKGYDSTENNRALYDEYGICPIIDKRSDWKDTTDPTRPLFPDRVDTVVYDVKGTISCICPVTDEQRPMAPWGFEPDRGTLKDPLPGRGQ